MVAGTHKQEIKEPSWEPETRYDHESEPVEPSTEPNRWNWNRDATEPAEPAGTELDPMDTGTGPPDPDCIPRNEIAKHFHTFENGVGIDSLGTYFGAACGLFGGLRNPQWRFGKLPGQYSLRLGGLGI